MGMETSLLFVEKLQGRRAMKSEIKLLIESKYGDMRDSEQKAADFILDHLEQVKDLSLEQLAGKCNVSQPTILRMVKALEFGGYKEFRYKIVEEMARNKGQENSDLHPMYGYSLSEEDRIEDIPKKIVTTTWMIMEENLKNISIVTFKKVIEVLNYAQNIDIYSVENSNVTAMDLLTKLLYLGKNCRHMDDYYHQRICASNLTQGDVAIGISYSGCSADTVEVMKTARKSGATTIVITNFKDSVISKYADLLICTSQDQLFYGDAIFSRTTQLLFVDMIYMGLLLSNYKIYAEKLDKSSKVVRDKAYRYRK